MAFEKDDLERAKFADLLISLSAGLASATVLPAGRVIAVDAPWGSGKSWIAKQLPDHFKASSQIGACVYVDAFEFDYHQDPFAVVTSAILANYKTETAAVKSFKKAAVDILKVTLPAVGKGIVKAGINYVGFDEDIVDDIKDAGEAASEKAISKMLDTFTKTTETTSAFKAKLEALVKTNIEKAPLVVVIDELDRCRPSFALEMLERVKHLFDVPNVVFIFFVHTPALHSAICKTYGRDINPSEYLRKFIAISTGLPTANRSFPKKHERADFIRKFLNAQYPPAAAETRQEQEFKNALTIFAITFNASFRDIENVMLVWHLLKNKIEDLTLFAAYFLLVRIKEPEQFKALKVLSLDAYNNEIIRLDASNGDDNYYTNYIRDMFLYASEPDLYANSLSKNAKKLKSHKSEMDNKDDLRFMLIVLGILELEYLRI